VDTTCPSCAFPAPEGARFCGQCGTGLPLACPSCHGASEPSSSFCTQCGHPLAAPAVRPAPELSGPEEERRLVSVLAVDLVGFAATAQELAPEDLRTTQREFFSLVTAAVLNAGGTVAKRMGDAVVAVFGAPTAYENDAYRAVRAGLDIQLALSGREGVGSRSLLARVGVSTGEALVTVEAGREEPRIAGEVLREAMALQALAPAGGVLVDELSRRRTEATVFHTDHGGSPRTWLATGIRLRSHEVEDALPLVGREAEMSLLASALRRVMQERRGQLVTIVAPPGYGKSRLVRALLEHVNSPATPTLVRWRVGQCLSYGQGISYWALSQIVKAQALILDSDSQDVAGAKLQESVESLLRAQPAEMAQQVTARLQALLGLGGSPTSSAEDLTDHHNAWRRYLLALAEDTVTVLVLEDLHWADDGLIDLLRSVVEHARSVPLLVLATSRPELLERRPDWDSGLADAMSIALTPLGTHDMTSIMRRLVGDAVLPEPLVQRVIELAGGVPLYLEEYARMLSDTGALAGHPGAELSELPLPDTVQGLVESRLDLLTAAERSVVSAAAVVGTTFWSGAIEAVAEATHDVVTACLNALEVREVLQRIPRSSLEGEDEYAFRHVLVRDAAYSRIPRSQRIGQHQRCADWISSFAPDRGQDLVELLAHHRLTAYELAAVLDLDAAPYAAQAREALLSAAERAMNLHAMAPAHALARQAVMLWYGEENALGALRTSVTALLLGFLNDPTTFYADGGPARAERVSQQLLEQGDLLTAAKAQMLLGQAEWYRGSGVDVAATHLSNAVDWLSREPAGEQFTSALAELARLRMLTQQYREAISLADRAIAIARPLGLTEVEANALVTAGTARYSVGDPLGLVQQEAALELCRTKGLRALQRAANNLAATMQEEGRLRRSYELIEESAHAARGWGLSLTTRDDHSEMALMAWYDGDWNQMLEHTELFLKETGPEAQQWESHLIAVASIVRVLRDEPMPEDLEELVQRCRHSGFPILIRSALAHLGGCRYLLGDLSGATKLFDELYEHTGRELRGNAREWLYPAVLLGSFVGRDRLLRIKNRLEALEPKTPWVVAATGIANSHLLNDEGRHVEAMRAVEAAVETYQRIGDQSSTVFARIRLARCAAKAGDLSVVRTQNALVRAFIERTGAVRFEEFLPAED
jgi:class 3 adenylate cyclase/tetratricopeptide (TPR) repeat protein